MRDLESKPDVSYDRLSSIGDLLDELSIPSSTFERIKRWNQICDRTIRVPDTDTPFTPPEQIGLVEPHGEERSRVYVLGMLGLAAVTGKHPWRAYTKEQLRRAIMSSPTPSIVGKIDVPMVEGRIERIIQRATQKNPDNRYKTPTELKQDLHVLIAMFNTPRFASDGGLAVRHHEFRAIQSWLEDARRFGNETLLITGHSGFGKTFLWETVVDSLKGPGERWLYAKAGQNETRPYAVISRLLESMGDQVVRSLIERTSERGPLASFIVTIAPSLVPKIPEDLLVRDSVLLDPPNALARLLAGIGLSDRITIFCFDDFQWLDPYSREVISALMNLRRSSSVVVLSRTPVEERPSHDSAESVTSKALKVHLQPLSLDDAHRLLAAVRDESTSVTDQQIRTLWRDSTGNPLALLSLFQDDQVVPPDVSRDVLSAIASERLRRLSIPARMFVEVAALIGGSIDAQRVCSIIDGLADDEIDRNRIFTELVDSKIVYMPEGIDRFVFAHDSVEGEARNLAIAHHGIVRAYVQHLVARARDGDASAAYSAVALLDVASEEVVSSRDFEKVIVSAARHSLRMLAPEDTLEIVRRAPTMEDAESRLALFHVGHEASHLLGDLTRMSHFYRCIVAEGSDYDRLEARYLWIRRTYADSRFRGAARIAVDIVRYLEIFGSTNSWWEQPDTATRLLLRMKPRRQLRKIVDVGPTENPAVLLASKAIAHILIPTMTFDRDRLAVVASILLQIGERYGWTPYTGLGFIAWAGFSGIRRPAGRWIRVYFDCATNLSSRSSDPVAQHTIDTLVVALGLAWWAPYREFLHRLTVREQEGRLVGNWEYVAHALHLHAQASLHSGIPLSRVRGEFQHARREVAGFGLARTDHALAKHEQAVDTLLGLGDDGIALSGSVIRERSYVEELETSNDRLSMAGYHIIKSFVALYADRPDIVFEHITAAEDVLSSAVFFHDQLLVSFLYGIAAYRCDHLSQGEKSLRRIRRLAREVPQSHRHRRDIVIAEKSIALGRYRTARRRFQQALKRALGVEYIHEAAYAAERLGDITGDRKWFYQAESLYHAWGAHWAKSRVRGKIGFEDTLESESHRFGRNESLLLRLVDLQTLPEFAEALAGVLAETVYPTTIAIRVRFSDTGASHEIAYRVTQSGTEPLPRISPDISLMLGEATDGDYRSIPNDESGPRQAPVIHGRTIWADVVDIAVVTVGVQGGAKFAPNLVFDAQRVISSAAPVAGIIGLRTMNKKRETELDQTKQRLLETERYRRQLFAAIKDAFLLIDREYTVVFYNPAAERYLASVQAERLRLRSEIETMIERLVETGTDDLRTTQHRIAVGDGHIVVHVYPIDDEPGLIAVAIYDISDEVNNEQELAKKERQLVIADRLASIGMFSSSIAHEVSNPNHILQLNTESLGLLLGRLRDSNGVRIGSDEGSIVEQAEKFVEQIQDASRRIESVVQLVKSYGREGRSERMEVIDLCGVVQRSVRFSRILTTHLVENLIVNVADEPVSVWGDAAQIEQAIVNLIKNACEALSERKGTVEVEVRSSKETAILSVCDTGRGFPMAIRDRIGAPFVSGRESAGSTGLGLSIVFGIVEQHGGQLEIGSKAGYTTCVNLILPLYRS